MSKKSSKRNRVPWSVAYVRSDPPVTVPVYIAYCGIAAALRAWNRPKSKFIAILSVSGKDFMPVYAQAAEVFLDRLSEQRDYDPYIRDWEPEKYRERIEAVRRGRAIFFADDTVKVDDEAVLFADVVATVPEPSRRHVEAALRRYGMPANRRDIDLLLRESWPRLLHAFPSRRSPALGIERLRKASAGASSVISNQSTEPDLRSLHGFGPLVDWGFDLATDLADYKAGRIAWQDVDAGVLISGPPGTGKTMFASALARTCEAPLIYGSAAQWQSAGYLNDFLKAMRGTFEEARSKAPSILFIDEVDAFGDRSATDTTNADYKRQAINGFLERLDGFERREGVVVVGACNHPEHLDPAIRRAGRLDRHFPLSLPDRAARLGILKHYSTLELTGDEAERFALVTDGMTGADIRQLVRDAKRSARKRSDMLRSSDLATHLREVLPIPPDYLHSIAVHEAGHAVVGVELGCGNLLGIRIETKIVADSGARVGGAFFERPPIARRTRQFYLDEIARSIAGIAAETLVCGSFSDGATGAKSADLVSATRLATLVEASFGMGHTLVVETEDETGLARLRATNPELRRSIQRLLDEEFERAKSILERHRDGLEEVVAKLLNARFLPGDVVRSILDKAQGYRASASLKKVP
ncbi:AAA family ATPase [Sinorhizobium meliloti]|uniref:AAA family ATPase n=1 Tax=Rhizobium meliloti TaxID=382 RepID=UPI00299F4ED9